MARLFGDEGAEAERTGEPGGDRELSAPGGLAGDRELSAPGAPALAPLDGRGEQPSLEDLVCGLWQEVLTEGHADCPLCGGEMVGRVSAHARATEGRCRDCGTTIA